MAKEIEPVCVYNTVVSYVYVFAHAQLASEPR